MPTEKHKSGKKEPKASTTLPTEKHKSGKKKPEASPTSFFQDESKDIYDIIKSRESKLESGSLSRDKPSLFEEDDKGIDLTTLINWNDTVINWHDEVDLMIDKRNNDKGSAAREAKAKDKAAEKAMQKTLDKAKESVVSLKEKLEGLKSRYLTGSEDKNLIKSLLIDKVPLINIINKNSVGPLTSEDGFPLLLDAQIKYTKKPNSETKKGVEFFGQICELDMYQQVRLLLSNYDSSKTPSQKAKYIEILKMVKEQNLLPSEDLQEAVKSVFDDLARANTKGRKNIFVDAIDRNDKMDQEFYLLLNPDPAVLLNILRCNPPKQGSTDNIIGLISQNMFPEGINHIEEDKPVFFDSFLHSTVQECKDLMLLRPNMHLSVKGGKKLHHVAAKYGNFDLLQALLEDKGDFGKYKADLYSKSEISSVSRYSKPTFSYCKSTLYYFAEGVKKYNNEENKNSDTPQGLDDSRIQKDAQMKDICTKLIGQIKKDEPKHLLSELENAAKIIGKGPIKDLLQQEIEQEKLKQATAKKSIPSGRKTLSQRLSAVFSKEKPSADKSNER